jgi:hypothetical protein
MNPLVEAERLVRLTIVELTKTDVTCLASQTTFDLIADLCAIGKTLKNQIEENKQK